MKALAVLLLLTSGALAHPRHVSHGEAHWRPGKQVLEVALRVATHDLARATKRALFGPEADRVLADYVARRVKVYGPGAGPLRWIGHEAAPTETWLYFELPVRDLTGAELENRMFFEFSIKQMNLMILHIGARRLSLGFHRLQARQAIPPGK